MVNRLKDSSDGGESSVVVERESMNRLEQVVDALKKGESDLKVKVRDLLSPEKAAFQLS